MMKYPLAWAVVWIIPTCVHVYHASGERWGTPQWLTILEKVNLPFKVKFSTPTDHPGVPRPVLHPKD